MTEETTQPTVVFLHFQACTCVHGILCTSKLLKRLKQTTELCGRQSCRDLSHWSDQVWFGKKPNRQNTLRSAEHSTKLETAYANKQRPLLQQGDMPSENPPTQTLSRGRELFLPLRHYWSTSHFPLHPALTWHLFYIITVRHKQEPTDSKVLNNFLEGPKIHLLPAYKRGKIYSLESYKTPNIIDQLLLWCQRQQKDTWVLGFNQAWAPPFRDRK